MAKPRTPRFDLAQDIRRQFLGAEHVEKQSDLRVVLYSHDAMGIGHMRRNLLIASQIKAQFPRASILVIAGAKEANIFAQAAGIECLTLPSFLKRKDGTYTSRNLGISASEVLDVRSQTILAAIRSFAPNLLIADKIPAGAGGELLPSLEWLSAHTACQCVWGLREILDSTDKVIRDFHSMHAFSIVRKHFHSIWIYGDRNVFDSVNEYQFPDDLAARTIFTGYLDPRSRLNGVSDSNEQEARVLCTVGGGQDGKPLAMSFIEAIRDTGLKSVLLTGPYMPRSTQQLLREAAATVGSLQVIEFAEEGDLLIRAASHVIAMGGYNTIAAILTYKKPALIVPRVTPRTEQLIRANRLAELGLIHSLHPDNLTSSAIATWLTDAHTTFQQNSQPVDLNGLDRICELIQAQFPESLARQPRNLTNGKANACVR